MELWRREIKIRALTNDDSDKIAELIVGQTDMKLLEMINETINLPVLVVN